MLRTVASFSRYGRTCRQFSLKSCQYVPSNISELNISYIQSRAIVQKASFSTGTEQDSFPRWTSNLRINTAQSESASSTNVHITIAPVDVFYPHMQNHQFEEDSDSNSDSETSHASPYDPTYGVFTKKLQKPHKSVITASQDAIHIGYSLPIASKIDQDAFYKAGTELIKLMKQHKLSNAIISFDLPETLAEIDPEIAANTFAHAAKGANYAFSRHVSKVSKRPFEVKELSIQSNNSNKWNNAFTKMAEGPSESTWDHLSDGMYLARDLANEREAHVNCEAMEQIAADLAQQFPDKFKLTVVSDEQLKDEGMEMLHAVGQAGRHAPRLVLLEYRGDESQSDTFPVALVGKGVVFDTGGLNLKPTGFIENMHMDMGGAAATIGAALAVAKAGVKKNIIFALPLAENAINEAAYKPHAILKSYKGLTVQVGNTDAEGRLILADAMTYVQKHFKPDTLIDVATLTGACVVALGEYTAGLFTNDDDLASALHTSGDRVFEPVWRMPILPGHRKEIASGAPHADISSTGTGRFGGACTAAAFLEHFVEKGVNWAHVDIAGPGMMSSAQGHFPKGGTGYGAALLADFIVHKDVN